MGQLGTVGAASQPNLAPGALGWRGCSWSWSQLWGGTRCRALGWAQRGLPGEQLECWSPWSRSNFVQDLAFFPASGTALLLERWRSEGCECSGELRGGTVAVDLLIKINVLADKDDSAPIAIISQGSCKAASSTFLLPQQLEASVVQPEVWSKERGAAQLPECRSAAWAHLLAGGMLESFLLRYLGEGTSFSCSDGVKTVLCILSQAPVSKFLYPKSA